MKNKLLSLKVKNRLNDTEEHYSTWTDQIFHPISIHYSDYSRSQTEGINFIVYCQRPLLIRDELKRYLLRKKLMTYQSPRTYAKDLSTAIRGEQTRKLQQYIYRI